jgi:formylglycine-generating enzyme required for sulfatase activity
MTSMVLLVLTMMVALALPSLPRSGLATANGVAASRSVFHDCDECPEMVVIPMGEFVMGDVPGGDEGRSGLITLAKDFALGRTEITQGQWRAIMGSNPSRAKQCGDACPVENVSWFEAIEFTKRLSDKSGKPYRLPTEAEWEYACRAGTRSKYCGGENVDRVSWHQLNTGSSYPNGYTPHPVAGKRPNAFGLYDMSGNVEEWVDDCEGSLKLKPQDGSAVRAGSLALKADGTAVRPQYPECLHILRGGSVNHLPLNVRSYRRNGAHEPEFRFALIGFRVARDLP